MIDHSAQFFAQLASAPQPLLRHLNATVRFDIDEPGVAMRHWLVTIHDGEVSVSRRNARADVVVRASRSLFDRITTGECNAMAAGLRGELGIEGDVRLLAAFQRLLPGPPQPTPLPAHLSTQDELVPAAGARRSAKGASR